VNFEQLVERIGDVHGKLGAQASLAVNVSLTVRNWLVGRYILEYELQGTDRASYGARLYQTLAEKLAADLDRCYTERYLQLCRQFSEVYPQIAKSLISQSDSLPLFTKSLISQSTSAHEVGVEQDAVPGLPPDVLLSSLSFTHFVELLKIEDALKRAFYEAECIRGTWSVRELKRQIGSLYFERSGLSRDKTKLAAMAQAKAEHKTPALPIRDPYVFEFLGLAPCEVMHESRLEKALLDKLKDFLLELGRGFCFEACQRRILIGGEYYFVDLVFYHRILKCHVLIELKTGDFTHEYLGQLNTYVNWFSAHEMGAGDNPPLGILLCTERNHALVKYALAGMSNHLFVSKYQIELPNEDQMRDFLEGQLQERRLDSVENEARHAETDRG
jgi:predicted nuclease of restriction endonuclease-like (RecB) superfamily